MKNIIQTQYCDEMQKSYIDYSMSVITDRAVPDIRDGLKPVQRRTIYAMYKLGLDYNKPHRKSARIVGDTMGKYHPHGDTSIYESLVVMQQDFKKNRALVDGHGNFGSVEGDGAAAMRYTEARLQEFTEDVYLADIEKDVVDFRNNFDETEKEPVVLPARLPMALINGAEGIAVGMTTSIPPHNLGEVVDAMLKVVDNPRIKDEKLYDIIEGPDFPLMCDIINKDDIRNIYDTGSGRLVVRGKLSIGTKNKHKAIIITGLPPSVLGASMGRFLDELVSLSDKKLTNDILDISNETDENGIRIVVEVKRGGDVDKLVHLIMNKTKFTDTIPVSLLVIKDNKAHIMSLKEMLVSHIEFLTQVQNRKYSYLLEAMQDREEILEGLIKAIDMIDLIIAIIRGSKNVNMAKNCLMSGITDGINFKSAKFKKEAEKLYFTENQANAILRMQLSKLIGLEVYALNDEYNEVVSNIKLYEDLLKNPDSMKKLIRKELNQLKKKYNFERKTGLFNIKKEKIVLEKKEEFYKIEIDENDYIKLSKPSQDDEVISSFDRLAIITSRGRQLLIKVDDIPYKKDNQKGVPIDTLCDYDRTIEKILYLNAQNNMKGKSIIFITRLGLGKRVNADEFITNVSNTKASKLIDEDELVYVGDVGDSDTIIIRTINNLFFRTEVKGINYYSKTAKGPKLVNLSNDDKIRNVVITDIIRDFQVDFGDVSAKVSRFKVQKVGSKAIKYKIDNYKN